MPTELRSAAPAAETERAPVELDTHTLDAIRTMVKTEVAAPAAPPKAAVQPARPEPVHHVAAPAEPLVSEADYAPQAPRARKPGRIAALKARIFGYRPTPKHVLWAIAALVIFFRPWLVFTIIVLFAALLVSVFLIMGYEGFWRRVILSVRWYEARRPEKGAQVRAKLDAFAMRWDAILDMFPEGTVDALYLPDLNDIAEAEERHDAAMERRLSGLREPQADA